MTEESHNTLFGQSPKRYGLTSLYAVVNFGKEASAAVPILEGWLDSGDEFSVVTSSAAIIQIEASRADEVLPFLVDALTSVDYGIRCHATWHLRQLGPVARKAAPALERLLQEESSSLRRLASEAIKSITKEDGDR